MPERDDKADAFDVLIALLGRTRSLIDAIVALDHPGVSWPKQALPLLREAREIRAAVKGATP